MPACFSCMSKTLPPLHVTTNLKECRRQLAHYYLG